MSRDMFWPTVPISVLSLSFPIAVCPWRWRLAPSVAVVTVVIPSVPLVPSSVVPPIIPAVVSPVPVASIVLPVSWMIVSPVCRPREL
ncbi:hypothetical protein ACG7TL_002878 [Trametes sanguinea]